MRMSKFWRWIAPVAVAGGLVAASGAVPAEAASSAAYGVTISATSPHYPGATKGKVDGYALVVYKTTYHNWDAAVVSGEVTGAASGDVVSLLAEPFGTKTFKPTGAQQTLTGTSPEAYSFTVKPTVATTYEVQVTTGSTLDVTSSTQTVYVTTGGSFSRSHKSCSATRCVFRYSVYLTLPASAYKTESVKRYYLYQAVTYTRALPKYFYLTKTARASKAKRIHSGEYEIAFTFYIPLRHGEAAWYTNFCTKDTETRDGLGLPGSHGCGDKRVPLTVIYLG
jgi:hypothetical protein